MSYVTECWSFFRFFFLSSRDDCTNSVRIRSPHSRYSVLLDRCTIANERAHQVDRRFFFHRSLSLSLSRPVFPLRSATKQINMFTLDRTLGRFTFAHRYVISLDKNQSVVLFLSLPCLLQSFCKLLVPLCCVLSLAQCWCAHRIGVLFKLFSAIRFIVRERNAFGSRIVIGFFFSSLLFKRWETKMREKKKEIFLVLIFQNNNVQYQIERVLNVNR